MILEVRKTIELKAAPERVWRALTDPDELARWFPDEGADFEAEAGHRGFFVWASRADQGDGCGGGSFALRVEQVEPPHLLVWSWTREANTPFDQAATTRVEWRLTPRAGGGTTLVLRETGFERLRDREVNDGGWDAELGELVAYVDGAAVLSAAALGG